MANHFDAPPALMGDGQQQMEAMYRYLQQMSDQLNEAMNSMTIANFTPEAQKELTTAISGGEKDQEIKNTRNTLRSMIIKSAEIVHSEMEEISAELRGRYTAVSEQFGELDQKLSQTIQANAEGIRQSFEYIETLTSRADEVDNYIIHNSEYIFHGLIGRRDDATPIYGIAIGENITQYDDEGNPYINDNAKVATFTKERLSFWQGNREMAYFSDRRMYITEAEILNKMVMGRYVWRIQADGSMGVSVG